MLDGLLALAAAAEHVEALQDKRRMPRLDETGVDFNRPHIPHKRGRNDIPVAPPDTEQTPWSTYAYSALLDTGDSVAGVEEHQPLTKRASIGGAPSLPPSGCQPPSGPAVTKEHPPRLATRCSWDLVTPPLRPPTSVSFQGPPGREPAQYYAPQPQPLSGPTHAIAAAFPGPQFPQPVNSRRSSVDVSAHAWALAPVPSAGPLRQTPPATPACSSPRRRGLGSSAAAAGATRFLAPTAAAFAATPGALALCPHPAAAATATVPCVRPAALPYAPSPARQFHSAGGALPGPLPETSPFERPSAPLPPARQGSGGAAAASGGDSSSSSPPAAGSPPHACGASPPAGAAAAAGASAQGSSDSGPGDAALALASGSPVTPPPAAHGPPPAAAAPAAAWLQGPPAAAADLNEHADLFSEEHGPSVQPLAAALQRQPPCRMLPAEWPAPGAPPRATAGAVQPAPYDGPVSAEPYQRRFRHSTGGADFPAAPAAAGVATAYGSGGCAAPPRARCFRRSSGGAPPEEAEEAAAAPAAACDSSGCALRAAVYSAAAAAHPGTAPAAAAAVAVGHAPGLVPASHHAAYPLPGAPCAAPLSRSLSSAHAYGGAPCDPYGHVRRAAVVRTSSMPAGVRYPTPHPHYHHHHQQQHAARPDAHDCYHGVEPPRQQHHHHYHHPYHHSAYHHRHQAFGYPETRPAPCGPAAGTPSHAAGEPAAPVDPYAQCYGPAPTGPYAYVVRRRWTISTATHGSVGEPAAANGPAAADVPCGHAQGPIGHGWTAVEAAHAHAQQHVQPHAVHYRQRRVIVRQHTTVPGHTVQPPDGAAPAAAAAAALPPGLPRYRRYSYCVATDPRAAAQALAAAQPPAGAPVAHWPPLQAEMTAYQPQACPRGAEGMQHRHRALHMRAQAAGAAPPLPPLAGAGGSGAAPGPRSSPPEGQAEWAAAAAAAAAAQLAAMGAGGTGAGSGGGGLAGAPASGSLACMLSRMHELQLQL